MFPLKDDNPTRTPPVVTVLLVAVNLVVFVYELKLGSTGLRALVYQMGLIPAEVTTGARLVGDFPLVLTPFTSMFLHGGFFHLLTNMLYLWIFGNNIEEATGHVRFLAFYLICGLAAAGAQIISAPGSEVPMIGASGAIAGVLGAYMLLFPRARVLTVLWIIIFLRLVYLPAGLLLGVWFLGQLLFSQVDQRVEGGVAFFAHIGGFVAGMLLIWVFRKRPRGRRPRGPRPILVP